MGTQRGSSGEGCLMSGMVGGGEQKGGKTKTKKQKINKSKMHVGEEVDVVMATVKDSRYSFDVDFFFFFYIYISLKRNIIFFQFSPNHKK